MLQTLMSLSSTSMRLSIAVGFVGTIRYRAYVCQLQCRRLALPLQAQHSEVLVVDNTVCLAAPNAFIKVDPDVGGEEKTTTMMARCITTVMQEIIQVCIAM